MQLFERSIGMNSDYLSRAIYQKYIEPTRHDRSLSIGIEIEMPVVNLRKEPVDESVPLAAADEFRRRCGFESVSSDADGNVNSMTESSTGDNLSFDCSYSNLELSLGKGSDLFEIKSRFDKYYRVLSDILAEHDYALTGMGVNPFCNINHNKPIPNERYRMLYHYLHSYKKYNIERKFHDRPDFGTFTSASQVQLDVDYDRLIDTLNVTGLLEPYKSLLFANSYLPDHPEYLCSRNMLWERSMQGYNPHNIGMFSDKLKTVDELIEYIKSQSIYCIMRDGKYIDFTPVPVRDYFSLQNVEGEYFNGERYEKISFSPVPDDLQYLRTFKFEDLTFRGTIEYRSSCCQPISDSMTVAAFHTGLNEQLPVLKELLESDNIIYSHGYSAKELQDLLSKRELPQFINKRAASEQLINILDIASNGLKLRGLGEEKLLEPLYDRAERFTNPARTMVEGLEKGLPIEHFIEEYGRI